MKEGRKKERRKVGMKEGRKERKEGKEGREREERK